MAAPVYATDMTTILLEFPNTTGWTALGGGASGLNAPETDYFIQNANCITKNAWASALKGMIYNAGSFTIPTDGAAILWLAHATMNSVAAQSAGGLRVIMGSGAGDYDHWYVSGSDRVVFGLWNPYPVNDTVTPDATTGTPGAISYIGALANLPSGGPTKGAPFAIDAIRYGRCRMDVTLGEAANEATFDGLESTGNSLANRWGLIEKINGVFLMQGFLRIGDGSNACRFLDANKQLFIRDTLKVTSAFNRIEFINASTDVDWDNINITALGTTSRGTIVVTSGQVDWLNSTLTGLGTITLLASTNMTGCTFRNCLAITAPGSDLSNSKVLDSAVATDASAVVWNVNADPDTDMDGMEFTMGSNSHHAIEFGTTSPLTMTLRNCDFTGFDPTDTANGSTFNFLRTSGTITFNLIGCTGILSYKSAGATVNIVNDPKTTKITVQEADGTKIQNARVFVRVDEAATGPYPRAVVTISNSGTTATVTHTAHGLATNDWVWIHGASHNANNGVFQITVTGANTYTYTMASAPGSNPTGTIHAHFTPLFGLTDASGVVTSSKVYTSDQPVDIRVRKTTSPVYKPYDATGTITNASGLDATVVLNQES